MQALRQVGGGIIIAIVSIIVVIGGISLTFAESARMPASQTAQVENTPAVELVFPTQTFAPASPENIPFVDTATVPASPTTQLQTQCTHPSGWYQIIVGANDTIYSLAQKYATTEDALKNANCLSAVDLQPGRAFYVPPVFSTAVVFTCSPPYGWVKNHVVQSGENLFRIALSYGLTYPQLQQGNCMGSSVTIFEGQRLWVPNVPTLTPVPGITIIPNFPTSTSTQTQPPTITFTPTVIQPPTATSTFVSTSSPVPTSTVTRAPAITSTASITPFP